MFKNGYFPPLLATDFIKILIVWWHTLFCPKIYIHTENECDLFKFDGDVPNFVLQFLKHTRDRVSVNFQILYLD